jgi:hypothetical protein
MMLNTFISAAKTHQVLKKCLIMITSCFPSQHCQSLLSGILGLQKLISLYRLMSSGSLVPRIKHRRPRHGVSLRAFYRAGIIQRHLMLMPYAWARLKMPGQYSPLRLQSGNYR